MASGWRLVRRAIMEGGRGESGRFESGRGRGPCSSNAQFYQDPNLESGPVFGARSAAYEALKRGEVVAYGTHVAWSTTRLLAAPSRR